MSAMFAGKEETSETPVIEALQTASMFKVSTNN
jgi:hypothetical protein